MRTLHLRANGKLSFENGPADGFDEYISDPNKPVPYIGYIAQGMTKEYMVDDQRFASTRTDVLTYQTDVLTYQTDVLTTDVTVAGPIHPTLHVSTTGTDSDFIVKLIDVYPNDVPQADKLGGYQQLVRGEPFRGKFRNSFEKPEPFIPGKEATIDFTMPDINHTFRKGLRIMVQIQSSWFPLIDRNPQKFLIVPEAKSADFQKAAQRVYRTSTITLGAER